MSDEPPGPAPAVKWYSNGWILALIGFCVLFGVCVAKISSGDHSTQDSFVDRETYEAFDLVWPLTVDSGTLNCSGGAVTFETGGTTYAVNGTAKAARDHPSIDRIWADAPGELGLKKDIGQLIDAGLRLCS